MFWTNEIVQQIKYGPIVTREIWLIRILTMKSDIYRYGVLLIGAMNEN